MGSASRVIPEADCLDADGQPLVTDQRGLPRPVAILGSEPKCDVGAFEVQSGGTGGTGGTGGADPSILCNVEVCMTDSAAKAMCESAVQACIDTQTGDDLEQCIAGMILIICIAGG